MEEVTTEFAELAGAFSGDGWISKSNYKYSLFITGNPKDEKEYYERIRFLFSKNFSVEVIPRPFPYWKTFGICIGNQEVISKFIELGLPVGKKSHIIDVPNSLRNNLKLEIAYLRGLFDTDGCIYFQKSYNKNASKWQKSVRHKPVILFVSMSRNLMDSISKILTKLEIHFREEKPYVPRYSKTPLYRLRLEGKRNIKYFFEKVEPGNLKHINKFKKWLRQGFY